MTNEDATEKPTIESAFRSLPDRFHPERVPGWSSRLHFNIRGAEKPEWTVVVNDGNCEVIEGLDGDARSVVTSDEETYLGIATGEKDPQFAFLSGKVKVSHLGEMMKFLKAFK